MTPLLVSAAAGLIAGTVPTIGRYGADDRQVKSGANVGERDRRGGVAGNDREPRLVAFNETAEQRGDARREFSLALLTIRQAGIVGGVDDRRGGQPRAGRTEHGEAAEAGVEEQDGGVGGRSVHGRGVAGGRATLNCISSPPRRQGRQEGFNRR